MAARVLTDVRSMHRRHGVRPVVDLGDPEARDPTVAGNKAAALADLADLGLPVLPGVVLTPRARDADGRLRPDVVDALRALWDRLSEGGGRPLIVRSSSTAEDTATSSMAGRFRSIADVTDVDGLVAAAEAVFASAGAGGAHGEVAMAVLVQPQLEPVCGGVLFGIDPVTGDRGRVVVEAVSGGPDVVVSGRASGTRVILSRRGHVLDADPGSRRVLPRARRRGLVRLSATVERIFGAPQDVEWAFDEADRLWVFQSRPVTASGDAAHVTGPILGPGPVAETFPLPLRRLERDLWIEPLRAAIVEALAVVGAVPRRRTARSPVVVTVGGWAAADLDLLGIAPRTRTLRSLLNPAPPARRLAAAWRIGRLRRELPRLSARTVADTDARLAAVPALSPLSDHELLWVLQRARRHLISVHGHEVLQGLLIRDAESVRAGADVALAALGAGRAAGLDDAAIVARHPEVLALTAPVVGPAAALPRTETATPVLDAGTDGEATDHREALRLRARWLQELTARASWELALRLVRSGRIARADSVRDLSLVELCAVVGGEAAPAGLDERAEEVLGPPLPATFRLGRDGTTVIPVRAPRGHAPQGRGASPGRAIGRVSHAGDGHRGGEEVLVVRFLDPALATELPRLAALVSETGSTLSHLAILARELRVPTVVAVPDALERFPSGSLVLVDGTTGEVSLSAEAPEPSAVSGASS